METIMIMAKALEKVNSDYAIDRLDIEYNTKIGDYKAFLLLSLVKCGVWDRNTQMEYVIHTDGTVKLL